MIFFKTLKCDLVNGLVKEYKKYIIAIVMSIVLCINFFFKYSNLYTDKISFGDILFFITTGMEEYFQSPGNKFIFPALWMLVILFPFYITLYYPYNDLMGYGRSILINSKSRVKWWISKCFWVIFSVIMYFIIIWSVIALFCIVSGNELSTTISPELFQTIIPMPTAEPISSAAFYTFPQTINIQIFLLPVLVCISISLFQMVLSLFIKPLYSFSFTIIIMVLSTYYLSPFAIGNYAMAQRSDLFLINGVNGTQGIIFTLIISIISIIAGAFVFNRYDILNKE